MHKLYTSTGSQAAFGSSDVLRKAAATKGVKLIIDSILSQSETYTKFRAGINKFTQLKVQCYRISEILSGDLADVHHIAQDSDSKMYLLVFVKRLSRFHRVKPIETKSAMQTRTVP